MRGKRGDEGNDNIVIIFSSNTSSARAFASRNEGIQQNVERQVRERERGIGV